MIESFVFAAGREVSAVLRPVVSVQKEFHGLRDFSVAGRVIDGSLP